MIVSSDNYQILWLFCSSPQKVTVSYINCKKINSPSEGGRGRVWPWGPPRGRTGGRAAAPPPAASSGSWSARSSRNWKKMEKNQWRENLKSDLRFVSRSGEPGPNWISDDNERFPLPFPLSHVQQFCCAKTCSSSHSNKVRSWVVPRVVPIS